MNTKAIFEALPHVNVIWVKDGEFHLHPHNGGEKIERGEEKTETINQIAENEPVDLKPIGRPKKIQ